MTEAVVVIHSKMVAHPTANETLRRHLGPARIEAQTYWPPAVGQAAESSASVEARKTLMIEVPMRP